MRLDRLRQWHWMVISLVVGALVGATQSQNANDLERRFGEPINNQRRFEEALVRRQQNESGFKNVLVSSAVLPDRKGVLSRVNIVTGDYSDGRFEREAGKLVARWRPAFFVAPVPYHPLILDQLGRPDLVRTFSARPAASVIDFLGLLGSTSGVRFSRAWWRDLGMIGWTSLSFIVIGMIWPIAINLIVHGKLRRPPDEKGIALTPSPVPAKADSATTPADFDAIIALEAGLDDTEEGIDKSDAVAPAIAAAPAALNAGPVPVQQIEESSSAEFGAKQDDYYPTARRTPHQSDA